MAEFPLDPFPPEPSLENPQALTDLAGIVQATAGSANAAIRGIIDQPRPGRYVREMITWKTPNLGYVQMYINPQSLRIESSKVVQAERTKGGFVFQYGGEKLERITISGTTGSSGIEGINILQNIYRSEQVTFEGIAVALEQQLSNLQLDKLISAENPFQRVNILQLADQFFTGLTHPRPTLASLASNIDMFFQGILYRGFFESFTVEESASKPGWFDYTIIFMAYARQGIRRNFMPWHKQPVAPAGPANPLSFSEFNEKLPIINQNNGTGSVTSTSVEQPRPPPSSTSAPIVIRRSTATAVSVAGENLNGFDLRLNK